MKVSFNDDGEIVIETETEFESDWIKKHEDKYNFQNATIEYYIKHKGRVLMITPGKTFDKPGEP